MSDAKRFYQLGWALSVGAQTSRETSERLGRKTKLAITASTSIRRPGANLTTSKVGVQPSWQLTLPITATIPLRQSVAHRARRELMERASVAGGERSYENTHHATKNHAINSVRETKAGEITARLNFRIRLAYR
jgi:hypothetical protein